MTSNGHLLRESWNNALEDALASFKAHLASGQAPTWKRLPTTPGKKTSGASSDNPRLRLLSESKDASVHRKNTKSGEVHRVTLEVLASEDIDDLETWASILMTPEMRKEWDPAVESAQVLELVDPSTRICKTNFTLGWPANPRDAVTISRTYHDETTLVDVSTSLPRSQDEPAYLRPAPPYVRSHVELFAWCIQIIESENRPRRIRLTNIWQHDLKTVWNIGMPISLPQQLSTMTQGLLDVIKNRQARVPSLTGYGYGVSIERTGYDVRRASLTLDYAVVPDNPEPPRDAHNLVALQQLKEQRRLQRALEFLLPSSDGWDIRITTRASNDALAKLPWVSNVSKWTQDKLRFQVQHAPLPNEHAILKVKLTIEHSAALRGIQLNGLPATIEDRIEHELRAFLRAPQLLQDTSSAAETSIDSNAASLSTVESSASSTTSFKPPPLLRTDSGISIVPRGPAFDKTILARVRRNYIYFSSLLQEPEAKWKPNSDVRGVSVSQLDSIDPTLVVYKAEATFVGVGIWDLYSAIVTPGARAHWDKQYDDSTLLEDVNELTELWHFKTKPAWPVTGRDAVILKTVYKAPTTIHLFSFSVDDAHLFPNIPAVEQGIIRSQVDLQGWTIDALSPTTTQVTLLEQSDLKGWTGKATIPQQMIAMVAGVGEFSIKCGGPPVVTRLTGAQATSQKYDHERGLFRVEYEPSGARLPSPSNHAPSGSHSRKNSYDSQVIASAGHRSGRSQASLLNCIECELRCDIDTWASSLDIVVDPPPQSVICLRRHRLSAEGGGLWLTLSHDISMESDERLHIIVRRGPSVSGKDKGVVMVNGTRIAVDVEEIPDAEVKSLAKQKRVKPSRIPLDQPPVMGVIRQRRTDMGEDESTETFTDAGKRRSQSGSQAPSSASAAPKIPSPLSTFFTAAIDSVTATTQQAVAVLAPPAAPSSPISFEPGKPPIAYALDALSFAQLYQHGTLRDNWSNVVDKELPIFKRTFTDVSRTIPVHRAEKVIEGVSAEEVASVIQNYDCRKRWDDRFDSVIVLEEYGANCHTSFLVSKTGFPFRDRGMFVASMVAKESKTQGSRNTSMTNFQGIQSSNPGTNAIFCVSASFNPVSASQFQVSKYNPYNLPIGRLHIDAWIVQTLDPYASENYAIPSTKCTRLASVDYAGSVPVAFNSLINASFPRALLSLEAAMKSLRPSPEVYLPSSSFQLFGDGVSLDTSSGWETRRGQDGPTLLQSRFDANETVFAADLLIKFENRRFEPIQEADRDEGNMNMGSVRSGRSRSGTSSRPGSPEMTWNTRKGTTTSPSPQRERRHRKRSSTSAMSPPRSLAHRAPSREPGVRASSSAFSIGRDSKNQGPKDFVLAELHVDLRTFPDGYEVEASSTLEPRTSNQKNLNAADFSKLTTARESDTIPISITAYNLPQSPLYSSESSENHVMHLVRLTLPTAQYELPTVVDPLTGETRSAPPKPQWLVKLEKKKSQAMVRVVLRPLSADHQKKGKKAVVVVEGSPINLGSERDAARDAPPADAALKVLVRRSGSDSSSGESGSNLPLELSEPLAVESSMISADIVSDVMKPTSPAPSMGLSLAEDDVASIHTVRERTPGASTPAEEKADLVTDARSRFLGFLASYPSLPLLRFGSDRSTVGCAPTKVTTASDDSRPTASSETRMDISRRLLALHTPSASEATASALAAVRAASERRFRLSTLIAFMLIAFLLGSLLRSLLSPADFIYVVNDIREASDEFGAVEPGWREIKRLVELKYIVGGWDFQIAVVRRH